MRGCVVKGVPYIGSPCVHGEHCWTTFERVAAEEGVDVDEDLEAGAVDPVGRTDKAGAFDEGDLAARAVGPVGRTYSSR